MMRNRAQQVRHLAPVDETQAWTLLLALAQRAQAGDPVASGIGLMLDHDGQLLEVDPDGGWIVARPELDSGWSTEDPQALVPEATRLFDLYMPLCVGTAACKLVVGHLGQSLDGRVATWNGSSQFITGQQNLQHAHRMRALFDAVVVGANTVLHDDPRLTTRLVPGPNPVRVIIDPHLRLGVNFQVFRDGAARTLVVYGERDGETPQPEQLGHAEGVAVKTVDGQLCLSSMLHELGTRGVRRLFVEGGGITISRFFEAKVIHRLQVAVAPMIIGSGRPAFSLPVIERLDEACRLKARRFLTGDDVLFDCVIECEGSQEDEKNS